MTAHGKYRILICSNAYPPNFIGGAELIAHFHAKAMQRLGHEPVIFAGDPGDGSARHAMSKGTFEGLPVYRVRLGPDDYHHSRVNFSHRGVEHHFLNILRHVRPDVVHFHNIIGLSAGLVRIAAAEGVPTVLTFHDHWGFCLKNTVLKPDGSLCEAPRRCEDCLAFVDDGQGAPIPVRMRQDFVRLSLSCADAFISPSRYLAESYIGEGFDRERFHVVWNGIDTERFRGLSRSPSAEVRFTFVGYLGRHKGVHVLISALPFLERERGRFRVNIVGDGEEAARLRADVRQLGLESCVRFWGKVGNDQIETVYRDTDVFVLPSTWPENQPVTITEALTAGIPVIGSRLGGVPELIQDGETGYLFESGDPVDLAAKMKEFINVPGRALEYGERGRERHVTNTLDRAAAKIVSVYDRVVQQGGRGSRGRTDEVGGRVVLCEGRRMSTDCAYALQRYVDGWGGPDCRFILAEWLSDGDPIRATLRWVVDRDYRRKLITKALKDAAPLLVPESVVSLRNFCLSANCGLYFKDTWTAEACLEFLLSNEGIAREAGKNGHRAISRLGEFD